MDESVMLSRYWSLFALTRSATAARLGIPNHPSLEVLGHLRATAQTLDAVQDLVPEGALMINSGYRSPKLNAAVGGHPASAHMQGLAVDIDPPSGVSHNELQQRIAASAIPYDVCAEEGTQLPESGGGSRWIHLQLPKPGQAPRRKVVDWTVDRVGGTITRSVPG
jgi:hypothetical protein